MLRGTQLKMERLVLAQMMLFTSDLPTFGTDMEDFPDNPIGDHVHVITARLIQYRQRYDIPGWDVVCLGRSYDWAGHVARFGKSQRHRLAWRLLQWRGRNYLDLIEDLNHGCQLHGRSFKVWRWEAPFYSFAQGADWQTFAVDDECWRDSRNDWLRHRQSHDCR